MNHLHQSLMQKSFSYRRWHEGKDYHLKHWAIFIAVVLVTLVTLTNLINRQIVTVDLLQARAATTITAASCSQADVQTAINSAQDGDTVMVPAGTCTWTTPVIRTSTIRITKAITLQGAGIDQTIINDNTGVNAYENLIRLGSNARITGFTFIDTRTTVTDYKGALAASGSNWRIDHNKFDPGRKLVGIDSQGSGVIDHNTFTDTTHGVNVFGEGDASWSSPSTLGTANNVFIEDNTFQYVSFSDGAMDAYGGARYVFRYNKVIGTTVGHHGFDSGGYRAPFSFEIYENTFTNPNSAIHAAINFRGGSGVIYNNIISASGGSYNGFVNLRNYRSDDGYTAAQGNSWDTCNGTSRYDVNTPGWEGWPCRDQIGRGTDQSLDPTYLWNNNFKGNTAPKATVRGYKDHTRAIQYHILENRDFFNNTPKPGYTPYTYPHPLTLSGTITPPPLPPAEDITPPTVSITASLNGSSISRATPFTIQAQASDNVGVSKVDFFINGTLKCTDTTAPYTCSWNVPGRIGRTYRFQGQATDSSGNLGTSSIITVTAK